MHQPPLTIHYVGAASVASTSTAYVACKTLRETTSANKRVGDVECTFTGQQPTSDFGDDVEGTDSEV